MRGNSGFEKSEHYAFDAPGLARSKVRQNRESPGIDHGEATGRKNAVHPTVSGVHRMLRCAIARKRCSASGSEAAPLARHISKPAGHPVRLIG